MEILMETRPEMEIKDVKEKHNANDRKSQLKKKCFESPEIVPVVALDSPPPIKLASRDESILILNINQDLIVSQELENNDKQAQNIIFFEPTFNRSRSEEINFDIHCIGLLETAINATNRKNISS